MQVPANQVSTLLALPERRRGAERHAASSRSPTRARRSSARRRSGTRRAARRSPARASSSATSTPASGPSIRRSPTTRHSAARRPPRTGTPRACDFGDNPLTPATDVVRVQPQADRRAGVPRHLQRAGRRRDVPRHRPRQRRPRHPHHEHRGGRHRRQHARSSASTAARSAASLPARGSWSTRSAATRAASRRTRRRPSQQAILDGVNVINFSISGGTNPYTDPVELAFLDAYDAGIFVAASAGNSGPDAGTTDHQSPWVITVAASTQAAQLPVDAHADRRRGAARTLVGASITHGCRRRRPSSWRENIPGYTKRCAAPRCHRARPPARSSPASAADANGAVGRIQKGFNVKQGGAAGMILYNPTPCRHRDRQPLAAGGAPGRRHRSSWRSWPPTRPPRRRSPTASKATAQGDVMASFSSRGPGGGSSSSRTSPHPACRSSPATRRSPTTAHGRAAGELLPGDRRHVDVVAAHRRVGASCSRRCTPTGRPGRSSRR